MDELMHELIQAASNRDNTFVDGETTTTIIQVNEIKNEFKWSSAGTKMLIALYDKYRMKVGSFKVKSVKHMWQIIAEELSQQLKLTISPNNCENRWRVLERNYKKMFIAQNTPGRRRVFFEFAEEMEKIYGQKAVHSQLLLSSDSEHLPNRDEKGVTDNVIVSKGLKLKTLKKGKHNILDIIRQDRLAYQEQRLQIEIEKLEVLKRRNELIIERNNIIKEVKCSCINKTKE